MFFEKSCGAVVFTHADEKIKYLLIRSLTGVWGFPKGHMEQGETEEQTALREIREEVGLSVALLPGFRRETEYPLPQKENTRKRVTYFLGKYEGQEISCQAEEISKALLLDYAEAVTLLQHKDTRRLLADANDFLTGEYAL